MVRISAQIISRTTAVRETKSPGRVERGNSPPLLTFHGETRSDYGAYENACRRNLCFAEKSAKYPRYAANIGRPEIPEDILQTKRQTRVIPLLVQPQKRTIIESRLRSRLPAETGDVQFSEEEVTAREKKRFELHYSRNSTATSRH